jgi:hypothetical protein
LHNGNYLFLLLPVTLQLWPARFLLDRLTPHPTLSPNEGGEGRVRGLFVATSTQAQEEHHVLWGRTGCPAHANPSR